MSSREALEGPVARGEVGHHAGVLETVAVQLVAQQPAPAPPERRASKENVCWGVGLLPADHTEAGRAANVLTLGADVSR